MAFQKPKDESVRLASFARWGLQWTVVLNCLVDVGTRDSNLEGQQLLQRLIYPQSTPHPGRVNVALLSSGLFNSFSGMFVDLWPLELVVASVTAPLGSFQASSVDVFLANHDCICTTSLVIPPPFQHTDATSVTRVARLCCM